MHRLLLLSVFLSCMVLHSCAVKPKGDFTASKTPSQPDYSKIEYWAALPNQEDNADRVPEHKFKDNQVEAAIDVFFLHPTTYTGKKGHNLWNGPVNDLELNERTDGSTILYQASIFNGAGKVYAPRYRQAHLNAYNTKDTSASQQAFNLAYNDIKSAFEFYLENYNQGRPIIIAAHSQGTTHGARLLKEFFDGKDLKNKLVAAYLVGIPVPKNYFNDIPLCISPKQTQCFCTWRSYKKGKYPKDHDPNNTIAVTNPLSWSNTTDLVPKTQNEGGVLLKFDNILPELANAQIHQGLLWLDKPKFPGSIFLTRSNYHVGDFNLYYFNVRKNAIERAAAYLGKKGS